MNKWKWVKGYKGRYKIFSNGKVWSEKIIGKNSGRTGRFMKLQVRGFGYEYIMLKKINERARSFSVHRLVAIHFLSNPFSKRCVHHKDGNKLNNKASNLEWLTSKENNHHARVTGLNPITEKVIEQGKKLGLSNRRFDKNQILKIKKMYNKYNYTLSTIAIIYKVSPAAIRKIVKKLSYKEYN